MNHDLRRVPVVGMKSKWISTVERVLFLNGKSMTKVLQCNALFQTCGLHMKITRLHYLREMRGGKVACFNAPPTSFPRTTMNKNNSNAQKTPLLTHLVAGGTAGFMEACTCHPLDTIKVRMQLSRKAQRSATVSAFYHIKDKNRFTHTPNRDVI